MTETEKGGFVSVKGIYFQAEGNGDFGMLTHVALARVRCAADDLGE